MPISALFQASSIEMGNYMPYLGQSLLCSSGIEGHLLWWAAVRFISSNEVNFTEATSSIAVDVCIVDSSSYGGSAKLLMRSGT